MGVTLWLLRHAQAVDRPPQGGRDRDRVLTTTGEEQATMVGSFIEELDRTMPTTVLVSPAIRTVATAQLAFRSLPTESILEEPRLYEATDDGVLDIVAEHAALGTTMAVVGHNPTIGALIELLVTPAPGRRRRCPPGTLAVISLPAEDLATIEPGTGRLEVHRTP